MFRVLAPLPSPCPSILMAGPLQGSAARPSCPSARPLSPGTPGIRGPVGSSVLLSVARWSFRIPSGEKWCLGPRRCHSAICPFVKRGVTEHRPCLCWALCGNLEPGGEQDRQLAVRSTCLEGDTCHGQLYSVRSASLKPGLGVRVHKVSTGAGARAWWERVVVQN